MHYTYKYERCKRIRDNKRKRGFKIFECDKKMFADWYWLATQSKDLFRNCLN